MQASKKALGHPLLTGAACHLALTGKADGGLAQEGQQHALTSWVMRANDMKLGRAKARPFANVGHGDLTVFEAGGDLRYQDVAMPESGVTCLELRRQPLSMPGRHIQLCVYIGHGDEGRVGAGRHACPAGRIDIGDFLQGTCGVFWLGQVPKHIHKHRLQQLIQLGDGFTALGAQSIGLVEDGGDAALFGEGGEGNFYTP